MTRAFLSGAAHRLLTLVGGADGAFIAGDLEEEYFDRCLLTSKKQAAFWYWSQIAWSLAPLLAARLRRADAAGVLAGIALAYACLVVWAVSASAVISTLVPAGLPKHSALAIQIAFVVLEGTGTILAGVIVGFMSLRGAQRILTSPSVITLIFLILTPAFYFMAAYPDALPFLVRLLRILSVAPCVMLGAQTGRSARRWVERRRGAKY